MYITPRAIFMAKSHHEKVLIHLWEQLKNQPIWSKIQLSCFTTTGIVNEYFKKLGYEATPIPGTVLSKQGDIHFKLGFPGITFNPQNSNEIDCHIFSLIDNQLLVDFGLSSIKKYKFSEFPEAIGLDTNQMGFPITFKYEDIKATWHKSSNGSVALRKYEEHLPFAQKIIARLS